ncbi:hypothetical protein HNV11_11600 [Spirosoma taeanense]|uniref:Uncharacterized protein n=1 Tax=Spirosoma taeanense TaxID=2735870 RepID=A0A6M5Y901_9BACT|nr:hypothetical protein [Spirosoma taeanense]QJW89974.1 hypothetical protein HNV11_11600 [Spirosoma taeanense]
MSMRINFDTLFAVNGQVMTPKVQINIMNVFQGGPELSMSKNTINGVDPITWQGKDLAVELRKFKGIEEHYILGLAVA